MHTKAFLVFSVLALAFLAGCNDAPPSGSLTTTAAPLTIEGSANMAFFAGQQPVPNNNMLCAPAAAPPQADPYKCVPPSSNITGHIMGLPEPDGAGWALYGKGTGGERQLVALAADAQDMYNFAYAVNNEDISQKYQTLELRMGDFLYATAPMANGTQPFVLQPITGTMVTGTYKGKTFEFEVTGLPESNGTKYYGRLYHNVKGADGNVTLTVGQEFEIMAGPNTFEDDKRNIADYEEFHIHVGKSKINLYKGTL
jgi:hypothetical protein